MKGSLSKASGRRRTEPDTKLWHRAHQPESTAQRQHGRFGEWGWQELDEPRGARVAGDRRRVPVAMSGARVNSPCQGANAGLQGHTCWCPESVDWEGGRRGREDTQQRVHVTVTLGLQWVWHWVGPAYLGGRMDWARREREREAESWPPGFGLELGAGHWLGHEAWGIREAPASMSMAAGWVSLEQSREVGLERERWEPSEYVGLDARGPDDGTKRGGRQRPSCEAQRGRRLRSVRGPSGQTGAARGQQVSSKWLNRLPEASRWSFSQKTHQFCLVWGSVVIGRERSRASVCPQGPPPPAAQSPRASPDSSLLRRAGVLSPLKDEELKAPKGRDGLSSP